jgi:hypothetical protein
MIFRFINFPILILSFLIGVVFNYVNEPDQTVVYVYPTPDNTNRIEYTDKVNNCFKFKPRRVTCPKDAGKIRTIPIQ